MNGFLSSVQRPPGASACYAAISPEGIGNAEIPTDLPSEEVGDLGVSRDGFHGAGLGITPQRV
jgi:hypothetical protein